MTEETKALATFDEQLAALAKQAAEQEAGTGGGRFFSTRGGRLAFGDDPIPGNKMAVVILDSVIENVYYAEDFDPDSPAAPACYGFGRSEAECSPHEAVASPVCETCAACPHNKFGTADKGKGKACRNRRRLGLVSAGLVGKAGDVALEDKPAAYTDGEVGFMSLPPTALRNYGAYVKRLAASGLPPLAVVTIIGVEPDPKTQTKITFTMAQKLPNELIPAVMARAEEVRKLIAFPYPEKASKDEADVAKKKAKY